jgi:DNA-binding transcriptional MerR regulator
MANNGAAVRTAIERDLYSIGEVSRLTALKPFVLRYWETEFPTLQPQKSSGGRRLYCQEDVDMILRIKRLLYDEGFTIAGARRHLREQPGADEFESAPFEAQSKAGRASHANAEGAAQLLSRKMLLDLRDTLRAFLTLLERR